MDQPREPAVQHCANCINDALSVEILSTAAQREEEVVPQIHNRSK